MWKACASRPICRNSVTPVWPISGWMMPMQRALEARPILEDGAPFLAERQRHADTARDHLLALDILRLAGGLGEVEIVSLEATDQAHRLGAVNFQCRSTIRSISGPTASRSAAISLMMPVVGHRRCELDRLEALGRPTRRQGRSALSASPSAGPTHRREAVHAGARRGASRAAGRGICRTSPIRRYRRRRVRRHSSRQKSRARA